MEPEGTDPDVEQVIMEYLRGLMQKASGARAERIMAPPEAAPVEPVEPDDEQMMELAQASGMADEAGACPKCGKSAIDCQC